MTATGTFIFICSACGYKARLPEQFAGRTIKCPGCQAPQVAVAPSSTQRKTAVITRVAATPVPFTLPKEQEDSLAGIPSATPIQVVPASSPPPMAPKAFPSPLPGAIQVTTDRVTRMKTPLPEAPGAGSSASSPVAKPATGGTVDFTCVSCHARLRLPGHYAGKSILCPKCSAPQKVAPAPEPMDTTRSLAQRAEEAAAPVQAAPPGSGTGIRAIKVTPLPQAYPMPAPAPAAPLAQLETTPAEAQPILAGPAPTPRPHEAPSEAETDDRISQKFAKPHPSKSISKPRVATAALSRNPQSAPAHDHSHGHAPGKSPIGLIATAGILVIIAIALAGGLIYHQLALNQAREQLASAQKDAKEAAAREHDESLKVKELEGRLADLQLRMKAAEESKAPAEAAPADKPADAPQPADAKPADAKPGDSKPAEDKPVEAKPAPEPAAEATPKPAVAAPAP